MTPWRGNGIYSYVMDWGMSVLDCQNKLRDTSSKILYTWHIAEHQFLIAGKKPDKKRDEEEAEMYP